jgi:hypothetical protein
VRPDVPEERFDRITRLAQALSDVPTATVSPIDENQQWFSPRPPSRSRTGPTSCAARPPSRAR